MKTNKSRRAAQEDSNKEGSGVAISNQPETPERAAPIFDPIKKYLDALAQEIETATLKVTNIDKQMIKKKKKGLKKLTPLL